MINAEVQKSGAESTIAVIRKFSRRVQGTGLIQTVRGGRYFSRNSSKTVSKKRALKRIERQEKYRELIKEGKVVEPTVRMHRAPRETTTPSTGRSSGLGESTPIAR